MDTVVPGLCPCHQSISRQHANANSFSIFFFKRAAKPCKTGLRMAPGSLRLYAGPLPLIGSGCLSFSDSV